MPSRAYRSLCRFSGWCWPNFSNRIIAKRFGPAKPRGVTWKGAGGWVIVSHCRHENFSRTVWITFHRRGITSSVSVTSSPSFDSLAEPQQGQLSGAATPLVYDGSSSPTNAVAKPIANPPSVAVTRRSSPPTTTPTNAKIVTCRP